MLYTALILRLRLYLLPTIKDIWAIMQTHYEKPGGLLELRLLGLFC